MDQSLIVCLGGKRDGLTEGSERLLQLASHEARRGFVQVSRTIALEAAITRASTVGGDQFAITIQLWKDRVTGNWWMGMGKNVVSVGYWPAEIFTTLSDHAETTQWGGEVLYRNTSGLRI
ncbi:unnamed protein product [Microthlaspi erraticum]|uniref:Neprosin PEP catalytic domain-containing protein n=1 Tax=Microthlaspi erraticum TaxID=1685480 RepID=A0A6D2KPD2_9BRAS|nr:unnamed protein product [Microthlaspi erraticum]CAA7061718.1 unnamed protein product [Microthlaspi erraticum]